MVEMIELLNEAQKKHYAVPAINVSNMETVSGLFEVAEQLKSPVVVQIAPLQIQMQKISYAYFAELVALSAKRHNVRYALHVDHGMEIADLQNAVDAGFSSIMYDGSALPFEENVKNTRLAREIARKGVTLETEIGKLGGQEGSSIQNYAQFCTDPDEALEFVRQTNPDCLAVSIGNAHGFYKGLPHLHIDVLEKIHEKTRLPLVMHGASGLSAQDLANSIDHGICKINFFTAVDYEFTKAITSTLEKEPSTYMMGYMENARQALMKSVAGIIDMCGSAGRAE